MEDNMAIKTKKKFNDINEEAGFYQGVFLKETIYEKLNKYALSTHTQQDEIINNVLESFFKQAKRDKKAT